MKAVCGDRYIMNARAAIVILRVADMCGVQNMMS